MNTRLSLSGIQTIATIEDTCVALAKALAGTPELIVDCGDVIETDLTFVQMLVALQRSAKTLDRRVALAAPLPAVVLRSVAEAGIAVDGDPFWHGEMRE